MTHFLWLIFIIYPLGLFCYEESPIEAPAQNTQRPQETVPEENRDLALRGEVDVLLSQRLHVQSRLIKALTQRLRNQGHMSEHLSRQLTRKRLQLRGLRRTLVSISRALWKCRIGHPPMPQLQTLPRPTTVEPVNPFSTEQSQNSGISNQLDSSSQLTEAFTSPLVVPSQTDDDYDYQDVTEPTTNGRVEDWGWMGRGYYKKLSYKTGSSKPYSDKGKTELVVAPSTSPLALAAAKQSQVSEPVTKPQNESCDATKQQSSAPSVQPTSLPKEQAPEGSGFVSVGVGSYDFTALPLSSESELEGRISTKSASVILQALTSAPVQKIPETTETKAHSHRSRFFNIIKLLLNLVKTIPKTSAPQTKTQQPQTELPTSQPASLPVDHNQIQVVPNLLQPHKGSASKELNPSSEEGQDVVKRPPPIVPADEVFPEFDDVQGPEEGPASRPGDRILEKWSNGL